MAAVMPRGNVRAAEEEKPLHPFFVRSQGSRPAPSDALTENTNASFPTADQCHAKTEGGCSADNDRDNLLNPSSKSAILGLQDVDSESSIDRRHRTASPPLIKLVLSPSKPRPHDKSSSDGSMIGEGKRTMEESKALLACEEDPNIGRRKRQKTESPGPSSAIATVGSDTCANPTHHEAKTDAESDLWLRQLEEAASSQSEANTEGPPNERTPTHTPPRRKRSMTPSNAANHQIIISPGVGSPPSTQELISQREDSPSSEAVDLNQSPWIVNDTRWPGDTDDATTTKETPRVKVMKLRRNGKLASSPLQVSPEKQMFGQAKARDTSGRSRRLPKKMTVILKYGMDHESRKLTGSKIDAVAKGSQTYPLDASPAPAPCPTTKESTKPTHPFFLSKAARKLEVTIDVASSEQASASKDCTGSDRQLSISPRKRSTFQTGLVDTRLPPPNLTTSTFSNIGKSKYLTPKIPIWPPKDLHHVRGSLATVEGLIGQIYTRPLHDRMSKAKESVLQVLGNENILSQLAQRLPDGSQPLHHQDPKILRLPQRKLMAGRELQKCVENQLSSELVDPAAAGIVDAPLRNGTSPEKTGRERKKHPALANLHTSIETSLTAFDKGQCDTMPWTQKYAPKRTEHVLMCGPEVATLRDWIRNLVVSAVDKGEAKSTGGKVENVKRKRKRQRRSDDDLDGFVISSEEEADEMTEIPASEDELSREVDPYRKKSVIKAKDSLKAPRGSPIRSQLTNTILISGPSGCGKTALVHAVADEMGFEIFEINPGLRRSGKDIFDKVGDMTQNHLVRQHKGNDSDIINAESARVPDNTDRDTRSGTQGTMNSFFRAGSGKAEKRQSKKKSKKPSIEQKPNSYQNQKQSLILLEEVDILFEEDKAFWPSVLDLIHQSKRPVILTCNDEKLVPIDDLELHAILRVNPPPHNLAVDYLILLAANEGHILRREVLSSLYLGKNSDLRASINEVDFWCQMAIGDCKGGLEWMVDRWPPGVDLDSEGRKLRVTSTDTLLAGMGWLGRNSISSGSGLAFTEHMELISEGWDFWGLHSLDIPDILDNVHPPSRTIKASLDLLRQYEHYSESLSAIDELFGDGDGKDLTNDQLDATQPEISQKALLNKQEGYAFLQADIRTDPSALRYQLASAIRSLSRPAWISESTFEERNLLEVIFKKQGLLSQEALVRARLESAFDAIIEAPPKFSESVSVRQASAFDGPLAIIVEELAPYIRCIVASDVRLEQQRDELSKQLSQGGLSGRFRTTRASRAALEGGNKATTRKERHFPRRTNFSRVLSTGQTAWLEALDSWIEKESKTRGEASRSPSETLLGGSPQPVVHD